MREARLFIFVAALLIGALFAAVGAELVCAKLSDVLAAMK